MQMNSSESLSGEDLVKIYLRAQNLEQMSRFDDAAPLYEQMLEAGFDAAGPYDRLIVIYRNAGRHQDVVRVADLALQRVRTFDAKKDFYLGMRTGAQDAISNATERPGAEFS